MKTAAEKFNCCAANNGDGNNGEAPFSIPPFLMNFYKRTPTPTTPFNSLPTAAASPSTPINIMSHSTPSRYLFSGPTHSHTPLSTSKPASQATAHCLQDGPQIQTKSFFPHSPRSPSTNSRSHRQRPPILPRATLPGMTGLEIETETFLHPKSHGPSPLHNEALSLLPPQTASKRIVMEETVGDLEEDYSGNIMHYELDL
ncbi:hypothetical protein GOP47_0000536 [Adiantum capillus-veneris]|uniref:Uncharacterized protein n=1 Tax=Adiantum capillus-veneris TaxID=13818 RepID=A0A9D4ZT01_ADICA|nr:hypothetical protein GOP47_0000536 [Adiantum capillus-veneris]